MKCVVYQFLKQYKKLSAEKQYEISLLLVKYFCYNSTLEEYSEMIKSVVE